MAEPTGKPGQAAPSSQKQVDASWKKGFLQAKKKPQGSKISRKQDVESDTSVTAASSACTGQRATIAEKMESAGSNDGEEPQSQRSKRLIKQMFDMPTGEFTEWAFEQAQVVVDTDVELETLDTFKYVLAFADATEEERTALTNKGFKGFKDMKNKGAVMGFMMRHGDIMSVLLDAAKKSHEKSAPCITAAKDASPAVTDDNDDKCHAQAGTTTAEKAAEVCAKDAHSAEKAAEVCAKAPDEPQQEVTEEEVDRDTDDETEEQYKQREKDADRIKFKASFCRKLKEEEGPTHDPPSKKISGFRPGFLLGKGAKEQSQRPHAMEKIKHFAKQAKLDNVDFQDSAAEAFKELIQPGEVLNAVAELTGPQRGQLADALVDSGVVAAESQPQLEEMVRPGGIADKLAAVLRIVSVVWKFLWVLVAINFAELFVPQLYGSAECGSYLQMWLQIDSTLSTAVVLAAYTATRLWAPIAEVWSKDAIGTAVTLRKAIEENQSWEARFEQTFPGLHFDIFKRGAGLLLLTLVLMAVTALLALLGSLLLLASTKSCMNVGSTHFLGAALTYVALRSSISLFLVVPLVWYVQRRPKTKTGIPDLEECEAENDESQEERAGLLGDCPFAEDGLDGQASAQNDAVPTGNAATAVPSDAAGPSSSSTPPAPAVLLGLSKALKDGIRDWAEHTRQKGGEESLEGMSATLLKGIRDGPEADTDTITLAFLDGVLETLKQATEGRGSSAEGEGSSGGFLKGMTEGWRKKFQEVCQDAVKAELAQRKEGGDEAVKAELAQKHEAGDEAEGSCSAEEKPLGVHGLPITHSPIEPEEAPLLTKGERSGTVDEGQVLNTVDYPHLG